MSKMIDLKKKVGIVLEKRKVANDVKAQVGVAFDITGSMRGLYNSGAVQNLAERLLAVALRFDDNGTLDSWSFCDDSDLLAPVTEKNFEKYVAEEMINNNKIQKWGSTEYAPVLKDIDMYYFGGSTYSIERITEASTGFFGKLFGKTNTVEKKVEAKWSGENDGKTPVYLMFVTDGENFDADETWAVLEALSKKNIYIEFIGIGNEKFGLCQKAADKYDNVGFVRVKDISSVSDDVLYETLLNEEFCTWIKK
jgi:hypothetical protein